MAPKGCEWCRNGPVSFRSGALSPQSTERANSNPGASSSQHAIHTAVQTHISGIQPPLFAFDNLAFQRNPSISLGGRGQVPLEAVTRVSSDRSEYSAPEGTQVLQTFIGFKGTNSSSQMTRIFSCIRQNFLLI